MKSIIIAAILFTLCAQALQTGVTDSMPTLQSSRMNSLLPFKALSILSLSAGILSRPGAVRAVVPLEVKDVAIKSVAAKATASAIAVGEEESFLNSFISGASTRVAKELVLHPIDTVRARLQRIPDSTGESLSQEGLFDNLYDGLLPALVGGVPAGALFFGVKDFSKQKLRKLGLGKAESTVLSVMVTNIPYWVVRTPSEVLKTKRQIRYDNGSSINEIMDTMVEQEGGVLEAIQSAYGSYASNFAYALPADIIKFITCKNYVVSNSSSPHPMYCTVLYCIVLYCTVLYSTVLYCTVLYCTVLYYTVLYCTVLYCTLLYCTILYCTVLYCTVLYCTVLYCIVLYCTVLYCTELYCIVLCPTLSEI